MVAPWEMDWSLAGAVDTLAAWPELVTASLLFLGSSLEYVFPPMPGDTMVVGAAVVQARAGGTFLWALLFATTGSVVGSWLAWWIGRGLLARGVVERLGEPQRRALERAMDGFRKHGPKWLIANRFLPGIRAVFFIAAALAGFRLRVVLAYSAVSALLWNVMLVAIGWGLAHQLDTLDRVLRRGQLALIVIAVLVVLWAAWRLVQARRATRDADATPDETLD